MKVKAAPGLLVPTEADPRKYITDSQPVEIDVTAYYLRRMADNELIEVVEASELVSAPDAKPAKAAK